MSAVPAVGLGRSEGRLELWIEHHESSRIAVLRCTGRICFRKEAQLLASTACEQLSNGRNIMLDLHGLDAIDSAGIGQLVAIHMQARAFNRDVCIVGASEQARSLLALTNVASLFEFFDSQREAFRSWSKEVA